MSLFDLLIKYKQEIKEIAHRHWAYNIRVFGSVVRGEDTKSSDIDILVEVPDFSKLSFFFPGGLITELEEILGRKVDIAIESALKPKVRTNILKEAKSLWI